MIIDKIPIQSLTPLLGEEWVLMNRDKMKGLYAMIPDGAVQKLSPKYKRREGRVCIVLLESYPLAPDGSGIPVVVSRVEDTGFVYICEFEKKWINVIPPLSFYQAKCSEENNPPVRNNLPQPKH